MTEKVEVSPIKTDDDKQDQLVSKLKDELIKARTDTLNLAKQELADRRKRVNRLIAKKNNYAESLSKKLEINEKDLAMAAKNIEEKRRILIDTTNQLYEVVHQGGDDDQFNAFLTKHTRELNALQDEKAKVCQKANQTREWMNSKITKNNEALQTHMERIQAMEKRIQELEDKLKKADGDE